MQRVPTIAAIVDQHVEDAAFLWFRRRLEIDGPFLDDTEIGRIDLRLDANLDGLMASGEAGWRKALDRFADYPEAGELFVIAWLAFRHGEKDAVEVAIEAARASGRQGHGGFSGALARVTRESLDGHIGSWLDARDPLLRCFGLAALWHHRIDPGTRLEDLLLNDDKEVRLRALRLAGGLKRRDMLPNIVRLLDSQSPDEMLAASSALCLLGEAKMAHPAIDRLVLKDAELASLAIELRVLSSSAEQGKRWLQERLGQVHLRVAATAAIGLFGDTAVMPWLIERMREPGHAYAAGRALRDLFAIDFGDTDLFTIEAESLGVDFAQIEDSPLPIADKVEAWWNRDKGGRDHALFRSMRHQRLASWRAALADISTPLADWRRTRRIAAWI